MKTLLTLAVLFALVFAYIFSATLYMQGELIAAYALIMASITGFIFWIQKVSTRPLPNAARK